MASIESLKRKRIKERGRLGKGKVLKGVRINRNCQLQESWVWPAQVEDLVKSFIDKKGKTLNICAGLSSIGDIKIDAEPQRNDVRKADMNKLPFEDDSFDTVLSDPPWKLNLFRRQKPFFEAVRVCKKGKTLNICAGLSSIGDIKIDAEPQRNDVRKADMNKLPFEDDSFDTVLSDPPWKLNLFRRQKPFFEAVRVCKIGGRIIYNCVWRPTSKYAELEKVYLRTDNNWTNISAIWVFRKVKDT